MLLVIEEFLTKTEVAQIREQLKSAQWSDGRSTAGGRNARAKKNGQVDFHCDVGQSLGQQLLQKMGHHPRLVSAALPHRIFPPVFSLYQQDEHYGAHVDAAVMQIPGTGEVMRSDVSMTLFLSPPENYDGGELEIEGQFGAQAIKLNAGDAVIYPSSSLHRVTPVTRGKRLAMVTWMQSMVAETEQRAMLYDMDQAIQALSAADPESPEVLKLTGVYHNLVRSFAKI